MSLWDRVPLTVLPRCPFRYMSHGAQRVRNNLGVLHEQFEDLVNAMDMVGFTDDVSFYSFFPLFLFAFLFAFLPSFFLSFFHLCFFIKKFMRHNKTFMTFQTLFWLGWRCNSVRMYSQLCLTSLLCCADSLRKLTQPQTTTTTTNKHANNLTAITMQPWQPFRVFWNPQFRTVCRNMSFMWLIFWSSWEVRRHKLIRVLELREGRMETGLFCVDYERVEKCACISELWLTVLLSFVDFRSSWYGLRKMDRDLNSNTEKKEK